MAEHRVLIVLKKRSSNGYLEAGIVVSVQDPDLVLGVCTDKSDGFFFLVYVTDLELELEIELLERVKKLRVPSVGDPMCDALIPTDNRAGRITTDTKTLLNYIELTNA